MRHRIWGLVFVVPLALSGCATLFKGASQPIAVASNQDSTLIRVPGTAYADIAAPVVLRVVPRKTLAVQATRDQVTWTTRTVTRRFDKRTVLNFVNPVGWAVDLISGAAWRHSTDAILFSYPAQIVVRRDTVYINRPTTLPHDTVAAAVLTALAATAKQIGCDPITVDDLAAAAAAYRIETPPSVVLDEQARQVVATFRSRLEDICEGVSPLLDELNMELSLLERLEESVAPPSGLLDPLFYDFGDSHPRMEYANRLREIAQALSTLRGSFLLVVTGFSDPAGPQEFNYRLGLARAATVVEQLWSHGAPLDCCVTRSLGESEAGQVALGRSRDMPDAILNRRVTFEIVFR